MTFTATTIYLIAAGLMLGVLPLLYRALKGQPARWIVTITISFVCCYAVLGADRIARSLNGLSATDAFAAEADRWLAGDSPMAELARELLEIEPSLREEILRFAGASSPDEAFAQGAALGWRVGGTIGARIGAASDKRVQSVAVLLAQATDRLPRDGQACLAMLRPPGTTTWLRDLHAALPHWETDFARAATAMFREAKTRPPAGRPGTADMTFLQDRMETFYFGLTGAEQDALLGADESMQSLLAGGQVCGLYRKLFRFIADQPAPEAGRLLRLIFLMASEPV